jgi:uncharacterized protein YggE
VSSRFVQTISVFGIGIVALLVIVGLAWKSSIVLAAPNRADAPSPRVITVSGTGRVTTPPDQATLTMGVQMTAPTLAEATQQASANMTRVLDAIKAQGIDPKEIQTSQYNVNPITNYKQGQTPQITGYQVMNVVTVTVNNLDNVGKVLDAGMSAGANYLGGVNFGVADRAPYEMDARTAAVQNATQKAQTLAQAAGVKLGQVLSLSETTSSLPPPVPRGMALVADSAAAGPVESGALQISVNVEMRFEITE